jgi:hypothetical protein
MVEGYLRRRRPGPPTWKLELLFWNRLRLNLMIDWLAKVEAFLVAFVVVPFPALI